MTQQEFFSDIDLGNRYSVHRQTVWRWVREGLLSPPVRLSGKCTRWTRVMIDEFEARRANDSGKAA